MTPILQVFSSKEEEECFSEPFAMSVVEFIGMTLTLQQNRQTSSAMI
jgi:hypothetical protein